MEGETEKQKKKKEIDRKVNSVLNNILQDSTLKQWC